MEKRKLMLLSSVLSVILILMIVTLVSSGLIYTGKAIQKPCTCASYGYKCGYQTICGKTENCGTCSSGYSCAANGTCIKLCSPETNNQFCSRLGKNCGSVTGVDNCGSSRTTTCGSCASNQMCTNGLCTQNCTPESNTQFCSRLGKNCGSVTGVDNCGSSRTTTCGSCASNQMCTNGLCTQNCTPESNTQFCSRLGKNCGSVTGYNNCGKLITTDCGVCKGGSVCQDGKCTNCSATCASLGFQCGVYNICNKTLNCGACPSGYTCNSGNGTCVKSVCIPGNCSSLGKNCGTVSDGCGKIINCGTCILPATCGGSGVSNVCGCTAETNIQFCSRLGKNCGSVTAYNNCGTLRTINCGVCLNGYTCKDSVCSKGSGLIDFLKRIF